jgi:hypothetical protein
MNHPIIANGNAQARYNEMLQEAAEYRMETQVTRRRGIAGLITAIISLFA